MSAIEDGAMQDKDGAQVDDLVKRLRMKMYPQGPTMEEAASELTRLREHNAELEKALGLYREAVRIDPKMEGPRFMGSNSSALRRAWDHDRAALMSALRMEGEKDGE